MRYCYQLLPHANIRYQEALGSLGAAELSCMLQALHIDAPVSQTEIGGVPFLTFECESLTAAQHERLSAHSAILLMCEQQGDLLRPLTKPAQAYLSHDLSEVLKYKGKTSAVFTHMMINMALAASDYFAADTPLTVLDPMCGRGTTAYVALENGMNAVGMDADRRDLKEAIDYFSRYLKFHRLKHQFTQHARTVKGENIPEARYVLADTKEHYQAGDVRTLTLLHGDAARIGALMHKTPAHILVSDLPYGIQHAPQDGQRAEPFPQLMRHILPAWREALAPGGAMALSFNTLTLPRKTLVELVAQAGFTPLTDGPCSSLEHFVEQAVTRDVVIARR